MVLYTARPGMMAGTKERNWDYAVNSYARWLKFRGLATTPRSAEFAAARLSAIEADWPHQRRVFSAMQEEAQ